MSFMPAPTSAQVDAALAAASVGSTVVTHKPFAEVVPGSKVFVTHRHNEAEPFPAIVLESRESFGAQAIPALVLVPEGLDEPQIITDDGYWQVQVLTDGRALASGDVASVIELQSKPRRVKAIPFAGGTLSAAEIIRWAAGRLYVTYQAETTNDPEHLLINAKDRMSVGDVLLLEAGNAYTVLTPNVVARLYEVVEPE